MLQTVIDLLDCSVSWYRTKKMMGLGIQLIEPTLSLRDCPYCHALVWRFGLVRTNGGIMQKKVAFLLKIGCPSKCVHQVAALAAATWWSFVSLCYVNVPLLIGMGECCSPCGITHSLNVCRTKCFVYEKTSTWLHGSLTSGSKDE